MKQGQLAEIKDLLLDLRRQLLNTIDDVGGSAETVELDQAMVGRLSRMDAMQHQEMAKAQKRRATLRLQRVEFCRHYPLAELGRFRPRSNTTKTQIPRNNAIPWPSWLD